MTDDIQFLEDTLTTIRFARRQGAKPSPFRHDKSKHIQSNYILQIIWFVEFLGRWIFAAVELNSIVSSSRNRYRGCD